MNSARARQNTKHLRLYNQLRHLIAQFTTYLLQLLWKTETKLKKKKETQQAYNRSTTNGRIISIVFWLSFQCTVNAVLQKDDRLIAVEFQSSVSLKMKRIGFSRTFFLPQAAFYQNVSSLSSRNNLTPRLSVNTECSGCVVSCCNGNYSSTMPLASAVGLTGADKQVSVLHHSDKVLKLLLCAEGFITK